MPIRTNRGRAAVYRRLWGWPLRSPKHLVAAVLFVVALGVGIGFTVPKLTGSARAQQANSQQFGGQPGLAPGGNGYAPTSGASSTPTATRLPSVDARVSAAPDPKGLEVARKWGQAWVNHPAGMTKEQWLAGLQPYTTEEYLNTEMATVDLAQIPANRVTGPAVSKESYTSSLVVELPTDGPRLRITLAKTPDGWRVNGYDEAS